MDVPHVQPIRMAPWILGGPEPHKRTLMHPNDLGSDPWEPQWISPYRVGGGSDLIILAYGLIGTTIWPPGTQGAPEGPK